MGIYFLDMSSRSYALEKLFRESGTIILSGAKSRVSESLNIVHHQYRKVFTSSLNIQPSALRLPMPVNRAHDQMQPSQHVLIIPATDPNSLVVEPLQDSVRVSRESL